MLLITCSLPWRYGVDSTSTMAAPNDAVCDLVATYNVRESFP